MEPLNKSIQDLSEGGERKQSFRFPLKDNALRTLPLATRPCAA